MQFRDEIAELALDARSYGMEDLRFHLVSCSESELIAHFKATFTRFNQLKKQGYSADRLEPMREALYEVLIEMRVRGLEADYSGNVYRPAMIVPLPPSHKAFCRQREKLKRVRRETLKHLCETTRKLASRAASKESKYSIMSYA